jgi:hypothetical protein
VDNSENGLMTTEHTTLMDRNQLKFGMSRIGILLIAGYLLDNWYLVAIVAFCELSDAAAFRFAPFRVLYKSIALPLGLLKPRMIPDAHPPHRFAAALGGVFNLIGVVLVLNNMSTVGWVFVGIVFILNALNFFLGFCVGCFTYYKLGKFGVPGFVPKPTKD